MGSGEIWTHEFQTPNLSLGLRVREILRHEKTPFQELLVVDSLEMGRVLFLDGCFMVSEKDEFFYHEMIAHVPLFAHPDPQDVLVVGGGDGGTLREILKHPSVKKAVVCDIDKRVTDASRDFFPTVSSALDDPRAEILHQDAIPYVREMKGAFDVIMVDSTDPVGPAVGLFEEEFYRSLLGALKPGGIVVAQAESPNLLGHVVRKVVKTLGTVFPHTALYLGPMPTYPGGLWSYAAGMLQGDLSPKRDGHLDTRYYSPEIHRAALALPPFVKELLR